MRAFENIIRLSAERLASRQGQGWLTPSRSRRLVIAVLIAGFLLVAIWVGALLYFTYRLGAWVFS